MNLITTLKGSLLQGFFPAGWDLAKIDSLISDDPRDLPRREAWWNPEFTPVACASLPPVRSYTHHPNGVFAVPARGVRGPRGNRRRHPPAFL